MTVPTRLGLCAATAAALLLAAPALAQSAPPLPSMPMPPSASEPAPKEARKAQPKKATQARKRADESGGTGESAARGNAAASSSTQQRPSRFVPEEFDQGGSDGGSRAKPFMSESGRPGMGMRF